jgi:golgi-specific brefeldin A-resistance guanine nucleotide exchange factor 1
LAVYLMRNEDLASTILQSLRVFLELKPSIQNQLAIPISIGMYEVLKTSAQNIHTENDWSIVFSILECFGAGVVLKDFDSNTKSDGAMSSEEEAEISDRGYTSDSELLKSSSPQIESNWIIVDKNDPSDKLSKINSIVYECKLIKHSPAALVKCWDSLAFIVRNVAHITPYNFELCVKCIRIFVEASMTYGRKQQIQKGKNYF